MFRAVGPNLVSGCQTIYFGAFIAMIIDTRVVPSGHSERTYTLENSPHRPEWPALGPEGLRCECAIDRTSTEIYVDVKYAGGVVLECARCLGSFTYPVSGEVRIVMADKSTRRAKEGEDYVDFYYDDAHPEVDISPALFDEVVTALPMKPLCAEECPGIEREHKAEGEEGGVDPRWEALAKLRRRSSDSAGKKE